MHLRRSSIVVLTLLVSTTPPATRASPGQTGVAPPISAQTADEHRNQLIGREMRLTIRPSMLADNIEDLAGRDVTITNARVVGVFEPHAFLIESATREPQSLGMRDRILVLIEGGALRVSADVLVASTVKVVGVARSLLGTKVSAEVAWPRQLDPDLVHRLEVRATVIATSVQTPEGIELTDRRADAPR
jgi:hypothetical protein